MLRRTLFFLLLVLALAPARAADRFAVVSFHDVVDIKGDLDEEAVTVDRLIGFLEWLRANHWTAISLDDVDAARRGKKILPEHSILITFDDGYSSLLYAGLSAAAGVSCAGGRRARGNVARHARGGQGELRQATVAAGALSLVGRSARDGAARA